MSPDTSLPSVTVVIPTHNRPELMQRAVRTVVEQDYPGDVEIVVVFDACDHVQPEVELPANRRIRLIDNTRRRGLAGARNSGILAATGDLVAFLDDDDFWYPHKLSRQVPMLRDSDAVMVVSGMDVDNGRTVVSRPAPVAPITIDELTRDRVAAVPSGSFLVPRTELTGRLGLVDEDLPGAYAEDYDLMIRAARLRPIRVVPEPQVCITWHGQSLFARNWTTIADALQYLIAKHPEFQQDRRGRSRLEGQIAMASAGAGDHVAARRWTRRALRDSPREKRAWAAIPVALRLLSVGTVLRWANRFGRGI